MKISVVIPALNEAENIAACIGSIEAQEDNAEVIVADGGSTDDTVLVANRCATVLTSSRGRAVQMNRGARNACGDVLLFLHADSTLDPGALAALREALQDPDVVGGTFTLCFDRDAPLLRLYAFCTRFRFRYFRFGDQGIFVRRSAFEQLGGFKEIPLMEDVDFLGRLRRAGRVALIPRPVTTSARRFVDRGLLRQQLLNTALVTAYALGASPHRLARWYSTNAERGSRNEPLPIPESREVASAACLTTTRS